MPDPQETPSHDTLTDTAVDARLTALEIKASFQEDLLDELNQVVVRQQQQIDLLVREVTQLRQQLDQQSAEGGPTRFSRPGDDLPPHY